MSMTTGRTSHSALASSRGPRPQRSTTDQRTDARKAFLGSLNAASKDFDSDLQARGQLIHESARALARQDKDLQERTKQLMRANALAQEDLDRKQIDTDVYNDLKDEEADLESQIAEQEALIAALEEEDRLDEQESFRQQLTKHDQLADEPTDAEQPKHKHDKPHTDISHLSRFIEDS